MAVAIGATERQLNLLGALLKAGVPVAWPDIARIEGYNDTDTGMRSRQKRFERDLKALESSGLKVIRSHDGARPYYQLDRGACLLPALNLTPDQRVLMYRIGLAYLEGDGAGPLHGNLSGALLKLLAGSGRAGLPAVLPRTFVKRTLNRRPAERARLSKVGDALVERRRIRFRYQAREGGSSLRVVAPYALVSRRGGWYLIGLDETRAAVRTFRLSRFRGEVGFVKRTDGPEYEVPSDFDPEASFAADVFGGGADAFKDVRIRFDAQVAFIIENEFGGIYNLKKGRDGAVTLHLPQAYAGELFAYLGEFAGHWEVQHPPDLRKLVVQRLKAALKNLPGGGHE
jgi:predicted DNA-binding transcriptional regulator YafY